MAPNPVRWFEIYVQDMPRAKAFYEGVFARKLERLEGPDLEMWAFPMDMGKYGAGTIAVSPGPIIARHMWLKPSLEPRHTITSSSGSSRTPNRGRDRVS